MSYSHGMHELRKSFTFEAAHRLPKLPKGHKCARLHGHSYRATVVIQRELDKDLGWIMDTAEIKNKCSPILNQLDHTYLNEIPGLENPTSEVIAKWLYDRIAPEIHSLTQIIIEETCTTAAAYPARPC